MCIEDFLKTCLVPELLKTWYTRPNVITTNTSNDEQSAIANTTVALTFCYCKSPEEGTMIAYDNPDCYLSIV